VSTSYFVNAIEQQVEMSVEVTVIEAF